MHVTRTDVVGRAMTGQGRRNLLRGPVQNLFHLFNQ